METKKYLSVVFILCLGFLLIYFRTPKVIVQSEDQLFNDELLKIDDYPLYTLHYKKDYKFEEYLEGRKTPIFARQNSPSCTCFVVNSTQGVFFGRNFDFPKNPVLILYTTPEEGYSSISMVDLGYFWYSPSNLPEKTDYSKLIDTPFLPFDGINEYGLVVGMAAVPTANDTLDESKTSIGEIQVIRLLLDYAKNVEEALALLNDYNVIMTTPPIHYIIADSTGTSVIVEYVDGEMIVFNDPPLNRVITNFVIHNKDISDNLCWRFSEVYNSIMGSNNLNYTDCMDLLKTTSQENTIWSIVYDIKNMEMFVVMGRNYDKVYKFNFP